MSTIAVLDKNTIDKIAAGEVVDRPASVVKELVENAIDAGASAVTVEIENGGTTFIRITDNGRGIEKEQVPLAFLHHATSKIQCVEDLLSLGSLGFRGEALSSIAAVSQVELITKTAEEITGTRYIIEGGIEKNLEEVGAPNGTTFLIRNLFFNTPARAKFLKTPATEGSYISSYLEQLALSNPDVSFTFKTNHSVRLTTSGNGNLKDVIYAVYGRNIAKELEMVEYEADGIFVQGYTARPTVSRGNRNYENYYVNGRYIRSKIVAKAVEDAYKPFMMQHKYPFTAFELRLDGSGVDVNVHPTKMEVRFSDQESIYRVVYEALTQALRRKQLIPEVSVTKEKHKKPDMQKPLHVPEPFEGNRRSMSAIPKQVKETYGVYNAAETKTPETKIPETKTTETKIEDTAITETKISNTKLSDTKIENKKSVEVIAEANVAESADIAENKTVAETQKNNASNAMSEHVAEAKSVQEELFAPNLLTEEARRSHRLIGQVFDTYWLVEYDEKLFLIDQHAAHEKVIYERTMREYRKKEITSQMLCPPIIISLNMEEEAILKSHREAFASLGFEVEAFGGKEYSIRAVPHNLYGLNSEELFIELLDSLGQETSSQALDMITDKVASMSCKAAVKGNHAMSVQEADALIDELLTLNNPYHCPHGRPTIISMTKYEMERKFKRIV